MSFKLIHTSPDVLEIQTIKGYLESSGITCRIHNENLTQLSGEIPVCVAWPEILVEENSYDEALRLFNELKSSDSVIHPDWECSACGEMNQGHFAVCWKCDTAVPDNC